MTRTAADSQTFKTGDRVRQGTREGVVTAGRVPVQPPAFVTPIPLEHMCRVRWDGNTFSTVADLRGLVRI